MSPSLWRCRDSMGSMGEVKRVPENGDGGKEDQAGYAEMLALTVHPHEPQSRALWRANHPRRRPRTGPIGRISGREGR